MEREVRKVDWRVVVVVTKILPPMLSLICSLELRLGLVFECMVAMEIWINCTPF